jgi:3-deoxy-D-manno-octulosonic-acid transferase
MLAYRLILTLIAPVLLAGLMLRVLRGRESLRDFGQRLGFDHANRAGGEGPVIWLHGASVGELTSARPLLEALLARAPGLHVLVTANTVTGRDTVRGWGNARLTARLAPLDLRACTGAVLSRWRPAALVVIESELWPNRFAMAHARDLPVALVAARMSARAAARWAGLGPVWRAMAGCISLVSAQEAASEDRLRALGLPGNVFAPRAGLKAAAATAAPDAQALATLTPVFARQTTVLAASTHEGEEEIVLAAFARARADRPELRLILAPRHPQRGATVAALIAEAGLGFARRSAGEAPDPALPVYLADTLGEMPLWYALSGICFVGGSLVDKGGHTPFEPAEAGCAILHGPYLSNFTEPYAMLEAVSGTLSVTDADSLAAAMIRPIAQETAAMAQRARAALRETGNPAQELAEALLAHSGLGADAVG